MLPNLFTYMYAHACIQNFDVPIVENKIHVLTAYYPILIYSRRFNLRFLLG